MRYVGSKAVWSARRGRGMALVLVLWIVAALAIFANSLGGVVRREAAVAGVARQMAEGRAIGEAAIYQLLQRMVLKPLDFREYTVVPVLLGDRIIEVSITPWSGLVNINDAQPALLSLLLSRAAGLDGGAADALAQAIVQARLVSGGTRPLRPAWDAPEDLLQVPGMTYGILASIRDFIVADSDGRGGINPAAAPEPLRLWLGEGGMASQQGIGSPRFSFIAKVPFEGAGDALVVRQVDLEGGGRPGRLPWIILSASQAWRGRM
ncbi:hypothetical protein KP729_001428|nr:hypothetical protein [Delftia acidovorans]